MLEDSPTVHQFPHETQILRTLKSVDFLLQGIRKSCVDLPFIKLDDSNASSIENREVSDELTLNISLEDLHATTTLNQEQLIPYTIILEWIDFVSSGVFFIDGPRVTGKTFLYCAVLTTIRSRQWIAIAIATSGMASSIMVGGQTSHSRF